MGFGNILHFLFRSEIPFGGTLPNPQKVFLQIFILYKARLGTQGGS